ncbi:MAG: type II toxin-antitoxin system HipA family toxin [Gammaproteobacteria bacterium]
MAQYLWGKVFYQNAYAGVLREEPGERASFTYDESYLASGMPAIAHTLPLQAQPHMSLNALHPFFDNLVAEGWLEKAQMRLLEKRHVRRFELLLAFGFDCAGAVSVRDPEPERLSNQFIDQNDTKEMAIFTSRASLSGVQPKLVITERDGKYYPSKVGELSTHIAKFPSNGHPDLLDNEYLTMQAFKALLPHDSIVDLFIGSIEGQTDEALIIKRFDRSSEGRIHFEEFNALLGYASIMKYEGENREMSDFIFQTPGCLPAENYRLYARILAGILLGNTDMHFKNFAMLHTPQGLRLTPSYDQVSAVLYGYNTMALAMAKIKNAVITDLKAKHLVALGKEFNLPLESIEMLSNELKKNLDMAKQSIATANHGSNQLKNKLIDIVEKRWNGTFALIGKVLSAKQ